MKSHKEYRLEDNPTEKVFHDKFIEMFKRDGAAMRTLSAIVFGWKDNNQSYPKKYLTKDEEDICLSLIQWLGSPVGQGFLNECGFMPIDSKSTI